MLIKGTFVGPMSGKLNGMVASHNRGGQYFRNHVIPDDPHTPRQLNCRTVMTNLSAGWAALNDTQRQQWAAYSNSKTHPNRIGDPRHISGYPEYLRENFLLAQTNVQLGEGLSLKQQPPDPATVWTEQPTLIQLSGTELQLHWNYGDWAAVEANSALIVFVSQPQAHTRNFWRGHMRLQFAISGNEDTPPFNTQTFESGSAPTAGQRLFCRVNYIDNQQSLRFPWFYTIDWS